MAETIYFDTCALTRLTDEQSQARILAEAKAVEEALCIVSLGTVRWVTSSTVRTEIIANRDVERREQTLPLLDLAHVELVPTSGERIRPVAMQSSGLGAFDALHLAICEKAGVDFLLTVDDRFVRRAARVRGQGERPQVINPIDWMARRTI